MELVVLLAGPGCDGLLALFNPATMEPELIAGVPQKADLVLSPEGRWAALMGAEGLVLLDLARPAQPVDLPLKGELLGWRHR